jgi:cytoskeletal protein CcmA (bactofilin family)
MADQVEDLGIPMRPARPMAGTTVPPRAVDLSRPGGEPVHALASPRQSLGARDNEVEARTLIIGRGISLSGNINSCDRLIVEGRIEANLQNCKHITVAEAGIFNGKAAIDDAEIRGRFEGDLVVRKRLLIRTGAHVSGTITYGEIEIEAGGRISGVLQAHEGPKGLGTIAASLMRPQ